MASQKWDRASSKQLITFKLLFMNTNAARQVGDVVYLSARMTRSPSMPIQLLSYNLTAREKQVLTHIGLGYSIHETATALFLSSHTIVSYCNSLKHKLHCKKATQLAVMAERLGLLTGLSFHL